MKKFLSLFLVLGVAFLAGACSKKNVEYEPYNRSPQRTYENKIRYSVFIPFMYEDNFYAYYALGKRLSGPDKKGFYKAEFKNGPKEGMSIETKNIILKTRKAEAMDLRKGMVVMVNHWDPREYNDNTRADMWRKGVVYNLERLSDGLVMLEFPHDRNDFMATKETYSVDNLWLILEPKTSDPRRFLD